MSGYCDFAPDHPVHASYHNTEYGFPTTDESALFERLILEINQAGLSWETILKKREGFRKAYDGFNVKKVAAYGASDRERLLNDASIIRNRLKVDAAIHNAQVILQLGGLNAWLQSQPRMTKDEWVKLFKKTFKFTGGEITGEFLMSTGWIPGAHRDDCPAHKQILKTKPPWTLPLKK